MATRTQRPSPDELASAAEPAAHNEVVLVGRLSGLPTTRTLPSGDELLSWRMVVGRDNRAAGRSDGGRSPTVDTIDCVAHRAAVRRLAAKWIGGEILEVKGALRRRFWRGAQGPASRCEVEVLEAKKLKAGAGPGRAVRRRSETTA
ncbi:MAG: single-strand DNA-binding protein [Actinomycetota bacterium]|jgi:single-strand DNA-binding protein|nr:single-strand DNA-binding protein [Actinomycetota bacterium]MDQ1494041.1 single-strand DNA-binding protein [Actinomycetota bacterium]